MSRSPGRSVAPTTRMHFLASRSIPFPLVLLPCPPWSSLYLGPSQPGYQEEKVTIQRERKGVFPVRGHALEGRPGVDHPQAAV
jgi:hypothetical protein